MAFFFLSLILPLTLALAQVKVETNYPLRKNNFLQNISEEDLPLILWILQNLKDIKSVSVESTPKGLVLKIERHPILKEVEIIGNYFFSKRDIKNLLGVLEGEPLADFDPEVAKNLIEDLYRREGFLDVKAEIFVIVDEKGNAYMRIIIQEGPLYFLGPPRINVKLREVSFPVGTPFREALAQKFRSEIEEFLKAKGFLEASVAYKGYGKLRISKPYWQPLFPKSAFGFLGSLTEGVKNLTRYPRYIFKAISGEAHIAEPIYQVNLRNRYSLKFEGNSFFNENFLRKLVFENLKSIDLFSLESVREAIEEAYKNAGFFEVQVNYSYSEGVIVFKISEGPRYKVRILGVKVKNFPEYYEKEAVDKLKRDILQRFRKRGYINASVRILEDKDLQKKEISLLFIVEPGKKVFLRSLNYEGDDPSVDALFKKYKPLLPTVLKGDLIDRLLHEVGNIMEDQGYLDWDFDLKINTQEEKDILWIDYTFKFKKGPRYKYGRNFIYGNQKTHWREIDYTVVKEKYFSKSAEEESLWNLIQSGNFKGVRIEYFKDEESKTIHRLIEVREAKRGILGIGLGYNTEEKFKAEGSLTLRNLFGVGLALKLKASKSELYETYSISLSDKFLFSRRYFGEISAFRRIEFHRSFDLLSEGYFLTFGYRPTRWLSISPFFSDTKNKVNGYGRGTYPLRRVGLFGSYDKKDDLLNPKRIDHLSLRLTVGEASESIYTKTELNLFILRETFIGFLTGFRLSAGTVGGNAPVFERFFLGGLKDIKGYSFEEIGSPEGGKLMFLIGMESFKEIKGPLWVGLFWHLGNVSDKTRDLFNPPKGDLGFGAGIDTPAGFLRFDVARSFENFGDLDQGYKLYLSIGFVY